MVGKVLPFGYAGKGAEERFKRLMFDDEIVWCIADIRFSPVSRFHPSFSGKGLQSIYRGRYEHIHQLGNVNYRPHDREKGIELLDADLGIARLHRMLKYGNNLILLCACSNYDTCHRRVVVEVLKQAMPEVEVVQ